jgi:hypothetical protein
VSRPFAVRNMHSISLSPAWSGDISFSSRPETSTSVCSPIVRTVRGFAHSLITGRIGLPITCLASREEMHRVAGGGA